MQYSFVNSFLFFLDIKFILNYLDNLDTFWKMIRIFEHFDWNASYWHTVHLNVSTYLSSCSTLWAMVLRHLGTRTENKKKKNNKICIFVPIRIFLENS